MTIIIVLGAGAAFAADPQLGTAVTAAGCLYLGWLGLRLLTSRGASVSGSIRRICGGNGIEGQLVRIRPWESKVIEPQSDDW